MKKICIVMAIMLLFFGISENTLHAATQNYPLANISVYKLVLNLGYVIDTSRPAGIDDETGEPIYGTGLPYNPLMQSNRFANTLIRSSKDGSQITGIILFFKANYNTEDTTEVIAKIIKAIDSNIYQSMGETWINEQLKEFLTSSVFSSRDKLISTNSMNYHYKLSRKYTNNNSVLKVMIDAVRK